MLRQKRQSTLFLLFLMIGNLAVSPVLAQDSSGTVQNPPANLQGVKVLPPSKVEVPKTRTGVDPTKVLRLSLREAINMCLERNLNIQVEKENIRIAEFNLAGAMGVYEPVFNNELTYGRSTVPSLDPFNSSVGGSIENTQLASNFNATKVLNTGGNVQLNFQNSRITSNANSAGLNPRFSSVVSIDLRQPLLRNYRSSNNERNILNLKKQLDLSDLNFRLRLIDLIGRVQAAYYDLAFAINNSEIQQESVKLAAVQLRNNEIQVKAGTAAPIDVVSAQAELERRKDVAISATLPITQAENSLKLLLLDDPISDLWNYSFQPTDKIEVTGEDIELSTAIGVAMDRRPEIKQLQLQGDLNDIDMAFFKNQAKPQVDLIAGFQAQGLAGELSRRSSPIPGAPPPSADNPFGGGLETSLSNLKDFRSYRIGVSISLPLRNRTAEANIGRTQAVSRQLDQQKRMMVQGIVADVRNATQAVETARKRVEAAHASVMAAEEQLKGEEQKFAAGLSTNFFVLQRQNELSIARGNELRAKTDYNKARADLQRVMANNIP